MDFNDQRFIDLHIHSTASDGTLEPLEIIDAAMAVGLSAISITDHDTTDGCKEILTQPSPPPLDFLPGVEISASPPPGTNVTGSIHILGYDIDVHDTRLNQSLSDQRTARNNRSPKIVKRLNEIGINISLDDIAPFAKGSQMGRPHIAQAMLRKGYVSSINEAFDKYIGKKGAAYIEKKRIKYELAIELIASAGGIPVLAHPGLLGLTEDSEIQDFINLLIKTGLKGLEVYYPGHSKRETASFLKLARDYRLLLTGGSDFHGSLNPEIKMGKGRGDLFVGYQVYQQLMTYKHEKLF